MAARSVCLLALEIWAGIGPRKCKVRAQSFPSERSERPGKSLRALCPERSGGRGLARSGPPATIGSQKANQ